MLESIEKVAARLREWGGTAADVDLPPPTAADTPTPSSDSKEYKRALNQGLAETGPERSKGHDRAPCRNAVIKV